jgi:formylglycine-generating enzyme required for sulfatase activity
VAQFADGEFSRALGLALPRASSMPALQRALTEELGPRARQSPTFRTPFGIRDFFDDSIASPALTAVRIKPARRSWPSRRLVFAAVAAAAAAALAGALVMPTQARSPAPGPRDRAPEGMVRIARAAVLLGESEEEARRLFAECRELSDRVGCQGEDFESSVLARAVRPAGEAPATIESFYLDETEVTQRAFVRWLNESANLRVEGEGNTATVVDESRRPIVAVHSGEGAARTGAGWPSISVRRETRRFVSQDARADAPVTLVSWHGARRYCEANGKRLPTEQEWELAAGGVTKRRFPWGDAPPAHCDQVVFARHKGRSCEHEDSNPKPVGTSRGDVTPDGLRDLGGNVTEWTSSLFSEKPGLSPAASPCGGERGPCRVLRGGSYEEPGRLLRSSLRWRYSEDELWPNVGFRCARNAEVES